MSETIRFAVSLRLRLSDLAFGMDFRKVIQQQHGKGLRPFRFLTTCFARGRIT